ncbi:MAG: sigma-70 family RNA polymerase sigma factor [Phycisphaerales bacterium]|nr:sigma-70 family RNA polymerase sigma factor [Phycisphaerales bacterium]
MSRTTTTAVLHALRSSDDEMAWNVLVQRYEPILIAIGRRYGLGQEDARDVSQQTLLECVRGLRGGSYDRERGRLRHWLASIARHRAIDARRQRSRRAGRTDPNWQPIDDDDDAALELAWEEECRRTILRTAMERLRDESRADKRTLDAFDLVAIRGASAETAAAATGLSVSQVYLAKHRTAARLREIVREIEEAYAEDHP